MLLFPVRLLPASSLTSVVPPVLASLSAREAAPSAVAWVRVLTVEWRLSMIALTPRSLPATSWALPWISASLVASELPMSTSALDSASPPKPPKSAVAVEKPLSEVCASTEALWPALMEPLTWVVVL